MSTEKKSRPKRTDHSEVIINVISELCHCEKLKSFLQIYVENAFQLKLKNLYTQDNNT